MCTVSIIRVDGDSSVGCSLRIVCNRDERRTRPPAGAPRWRSFAGGRAIWPMDMEAGGTWIAATERGLALCLLNLNDRVSTARGSRSRGLIIPELLPLDGVERIPDVLRGMALSRYAPFRLLAMSADEAGRTIEAIWNGKSLRHARHAGPPLCFASSGLGDALVAPRLDLFESAVAEQGATAELQDRFHRHAWASRPELSVMMSRSDARTVSITTLRIVRAASGTSVRMEYEPVPDRARAVSEVAGAQAVLSGH
jgi:hypothetical protein